MNLSSTYSHHIKKRSQKIYGLVDKTARVYSTAYFHQLRVEIKKMNAVLRLVKYCSPEFSRKRILNPYKLLGKAAGEVREIQLEESVIRKLPQGRLTRQYLSQLKIQRLEKKTHFLETKNQVIKSLEKREHKILPYAEDIEKETMSAYFDKLRERCITKMEDGKLPADTIHELRTLLKEFIYNAEVIDPEINTTFKKTILLQDLIGKWHDYHVIISHLYNFKRRTSNTSANAIQLKLIRSELSSKTSLLLARINKEKMEAVSEMRQAHFI